MSNTDNDGGPEAMIPLPERAKLFPATGSYGNTPADGHGHTGEFTASEFFERAFDHDKAAKNGLSAGPNVSYVRTFQACAVALRYAAKHMFNPRDDNATWNEAIEAAIKVVTAEQTGDIMLASFQTDMREQIRALKK